MNGKIIKKTFKISLIVILSLIVFSASSYFFAQSSFIQTKAIQSITTNFFRGLGADISIKRVDIRLFNKIVLKEVLIEDQQKDTLFYFDELVGNLLRFNLAERKIYFTKITGVQSKINILVDEDKNMNIQYLVDELNKRDTTKERWHILANNFSLQNSIFIYKRAERMNKNFGIDFYNIKFNDLNLDLKEFQIHEGIISFAIKNMSFVEQSGFKIENLSALTNIKNDHLYFNDIHIRTPFSELKSDSIKMDFEKFSEFQDFNNNIELTWNISSSKLNFTDIAYFSENLYGLNTDIFLTGLFYGRVSNLKGRKIKLKYLNHTFLAGDFDILGLPDTKNSFFFFDLKRLQTKSTDLALFTKYPFTNHEYIKIPDLIDKFGEILYQGQLSGFLSDFVAYGEFFTDLGEFNTDISLSKENETIPTTFSGSIETQDFNLGRLINNEKRFGNVSLNTALNGRFDNEQGVQMLINGNVSSINFNEYELKNISIEGYLSNKDFDGKVLIKDPSLDLEFLGSFDFTSSIPLYNFETKINHAYLYPLNIDKADENSFISLIIKTNFSGNSLDNLKGNINLSNVNILRNDEEVFLKRIHFDAKNQPGFKKLSIDSEILKANIEGDFAFSAMVNSITDFLSFYLPSISRTEIDDSIALDSKFDFSIELINTNSITELYFPYITISPNTFINGIYNISEKNLNFDGNVDQLILFGKTFEAFYLNAYTKDSLLSINTGSREFIYNKNHSLKNFSFNSSIQSDSININFNWNNWDEINYSGNVNAIARLEKSNSKFPAVNMQILPSNMVFADTVWTSNTSFIYFDSTSLEFDNFLLHNNNQSISITGTLSEDKTDSIFIFVNKIPLSYFNLINTKKGFSLDGIANGYATINDYYHNTIFISRLSIDDFFLNGVKLGNFESTSVFDKVNNRIESKGYTKLNTLKSFIFNGYYYPEEKKLDFDIEFDKFRLNLIEPYISHLASNIEGVGTGKVKVNGKTSDPYFTGKIDIQRASFFVNYLQTKYSFSDEIGITPKGFQIENIDIFDIKGNKAEVNGYFNHKLFKEMDFDLTIRPDNFQLLNTYEKDNPYFYGQAFGSGIVKIFGQPQNVFIKISAQTDQDTKIFVPLYGSEEVGQVDFISFINSDSTSIQEEKTKYSTDLSGIQMDFDLDITPDAEIQIIFDKKVGDIIKGQGYSHLKMEIDTRENFNMYGDFVIEKGDYLFTLQNVINKKFDIEPGSIISFNGSPYEATTNLKAIYKVRKTSIYEITGDENDREVRLPVNCYLIMKDKLMQPDISFDIEIETQEENIKEMLKNRSEDEKNKQLISLLVLNKFINSDQGSTLTTQNTTSGVGTNVSELLSNQLSLWLSQISNDFDIGVNYRPGSELTTEEYEVALSTQILNDRVTINGNLGMGGQQVTNQTNTNQNTVMGDFEVDVKINKSGKLRVKAYTKANEDYLYEDEALYKQGLSLYYKEEFNSLKDLFQRMFKRSNKNLTN